MGLSHSWLAVQGVSREAVLQTLGMTAGEACEDLPNNLGIAEAPGGWVIVLASDAGRAFSPPFSNLAALGPAVTCAEEEHVMVSEARGYRDGREVWRVVSDCNVQPHDDVVVTGAPPSAFERIRAEERAEQAEKDDADYIFEIPPRLAQSICGFRILGKWPEGLIFAELRGPGAKAEPRRGFFARLFGRR